MPAKCEEYENFVAQSKILQNKDAPSLRYVPSLSDPKLVL